MHDYSADFWLILLDPKSPTACMEVGYIVRSHDTEAALQFILNQRRSESRPWKDWSIYEFDIQKIDFDATDNRTETCLKRGPFEKEYTKEDQKSGWTKMMDKIKGRTIESR